MSATILYVLNKKSVTFFEEFGNSWGTMPAADEYLFDKYVKGPQPIWQRDRYKAVWSLRKSFEADEKFALFLMEPNTYIPRKFLLAAANYCEAFGSRLTKKDEANNWPDIGSALREMAAMRLWPHARGACLCPTDIQDDWRWNPDNATKAQPIFTDD